MNPLIGEFVSNIQPNRFDALAQTWDAAPQHTRRTQDVAALLRQRIPLQNLTALEVGAGTGLLSFALADTLKHVLCIDPSTSMIDTLRAKIQHLGVKNIEAKVAGDDLAGIGDGFDLVLLQMAFHHIADSSGFLARAHQHIHPGGWIAIADLDPEDGSFHGPDITDVIHGFGRTQIVDWLAKAGFEPVSVGTAHTMTKTTDGISREYPIFLVIARAVA